MNSNVINIDNEILNGTPVFLGTRVPIISLFWHLQNGVSIDNFLEDFPTVKKEQVFELLGIIEKIFSQKQFKTIYENIA